MTPLIVVAEDDEALGSLIKTKLEHANFTVEWEMTGIGAQSAVLVQKPALAILDVALPGLDGLEILDWIKRTPELRHIPVIVITAMVNDAFARSALSRGASDFLVKPFKTADLLTCVHRVLQSQPGHATEPISSRP